MTEARFVGPVAVKFTEQRKQGRQVYSLLAPLVFEWKKGRSTNSVTVPRGFLTDFASVPPVARKFIPPVGPYAPATVIHDWLYKNKINDRKRADDVFLLAMKACGVNWITRSIIYRACRLFGWKGWGK